MKNEVHIVVSVVAGAVGGALIMMLALNSSQGPQFFAGEQSYGISSNGDDSSATADVSNEGVGQSYESSVVRAVEKANPAVVSIVVTKDVPVIEQFFNDVPGSPFGGLFGDDLSNPFSLRIPQFRQNGTEKREVGGGSGFLISSDGNIITNRHVVAQNDVEYTVFMNDGAKFDARVVARDPVHDIAVIKIDVSDVPFLQLADSDQLKVGRTVIAIGNALGEFRNTVSVGVISGLSRSISAGNGRGQSEQLDEVIQTDAAINPGNSGGPLLDLDGKVVGVNVAVAVGSENIGFALPANLVKEVAESIARTGKIVRPFLGVRYVQITPALQERNKLPVDYGVLVVRGETPEDLAVVPGSPADQVGLEEGDIILEVDGVRLDEKASLAALIRKQEVGTTVQLKVLHSGDEKDVSVALSEIPQ